ncbi:MAG: MMPL family transporter [Peptostreptococcaceae bacterium]|nr:MMPL family transporter [Peptostreptococcaceae bacterium]
MAENLSGDNDLSYEEYIDMIDGLPSQQASMFVNEDNTESLILVNIKHLPNDELDEFVIELESELKDTDMGIEITGKSVLDLEMVDGLTSGRVRMTLIGLLLVFGALLLIYRNPVKALLPIIPVVLIIGMSSGVMYLLGIDYTPITSTLGALVLGMGTEMTVMLMERYLEERKLGESETEAIVTAVSKIGKAIVASGLTTIGGFSVLMASQFVILRDFGLMTVINISLALFSTFIVLPPIILLLDRFILRKNKGN